MENLNVMDMLKSYNNDIDTKDLFVTSKQKEDVPKAPVPKVVDDTSRSEEHTSELQSPA